MLLYGDCNFYFKSEQCVNKVNRSRASNIHLRLDRIEVNDSQVAILEDSIIDYIASFYANDIKTDERPKLLSKIINIVSIICEKHNMEFVKLCLPFYLFGHYTINRVPSTHSFNSLCNCDTDIKKSAGLEYIELLIQRRKNGI